MTWSASPSSRIRSKRRRLDGEEAVGAGFEGAAFDALGLDHAAQARARFDDGGATPPLAR